MNIAGYAIRYNVVTLTLCVLLTLGGVISYFKMGETGGSRVYNKRSSNFYVLPWSDSGRSRT